MVEYAIKFPVLELYKILEKSESIKKIIRASKEELTDSELTRLLFVKLDMITDVVNNKVVGISDDLFMLKRISNSPTGKFQAWLIDDKILIISENTVWFVMRSALFFEGELLVSSSIWNEDKRILTLTLFYPVHEEYKSYTTCFFDDKENSKQDEGIHFMPAYKENVFMENKNNITEAIKEIITERGISLLESHAVLCAMLDDMVPLATVERNIVHRCLDKNTALNLIDIYNSDTEKQTHLFNIINEYLKECLGVSEEWRMIFITSFANAFSCSYVFPTDNQVGTDTGSASSENNNTENRKVLETDINFERYKPNIIGVGTGHIVGLKNDGTVVAAGDNSFGQCNVSNWKNVVAISARSNQTVALLSDGTVVETGARYGDADVSMARNWKDMVSISCGDNHIIAIRKNGKPFGCGANQKGQCDVLPWNNIIDIAAGYYHTLGLRKNGTVVAVGDNKHGECDVSEWTNIKAIAVGPTHSVGVRSDGSVVASGKNDYGECDVENWSQIIAVKACQRYTMGLRSDGTVILTGENTSGQYDVSGWTDIVSIGIYFKPVGWGDIKVTIVGVQSKGNIKVAGDTDFGQDAAANWNLFQSIGPANIEATSNIEFRNDFLGDNSTEFHSSDRMVSTAKGLLNGFSKKNLDGKISSLQKKFWKSK